MGCGAQLENETVTCIPSTLGVSLTNMGSQSAGKREEGDTGCERHDHLVATLVTFNKGSSISSVHSNPHRPVLPYCHLFET